MSRSEASGRDREEVIRLKNASDQLLTLSLEPWAEEYVVPAGEVVQIVASGPDGDLMEVAVENDRIVVYGWTGSAISVMQNGEEMEPSLHDREISSPGPNRE